MSIKKLRNQLFAAIAMVLVASIALGSSTYAWFVSNNTVKATTTSISAQSNSAYLVIDKNATNENSSSTVTATNAVATGADAAIYPATIVKDGSNAVWKTGYASDKDHATINLTGLKQIGDGTADNANTLDYNIKNTFYVGTGGYDGRFTNLKVTGLEVVNKSTSDLNTAIRVMITDDSAWVVVRPVAKLGKDAYVEDETDTNIYRLRSNTDTTITADQYNALAEKTAITDANTKWEVENQSGDNGIVHAAEFGKNNDVLLKVYVYYEGSDERVFTTNLNNLRDISVTITLEATPITYTN